MTTQEFSVYLSVVQHDLASNLDYRVGQAYFSTLADLHPELANKFRGTSNDPFYDDRKIPKFLELIYNQHVES